MAILSKYLNGAIDRVGQGILLDELPADPAPYIGAVVVTNGGVFWSNGVDWNSLGAGLTGPSKLLPKRIRVGPSAEADYGLLEEALAETIVSASYTGTFPNWGLFGTPTVANFIFELENGDHTLPEQTIFQNVYVMIRAINSGSASITINKASALTVGVGVIGGFLCLNGLALNINGPGTAIGISRGVGGQVLLISTQVSARGCSTGIIAVTNGAVALVDSSIESDPAGMGAAIVIGSGSMLEVRGNGLVKGGKYGIVSGYGMSDVWIAGPAGTNVTISGKDAAISAGGVGAVEAVGAAGNWDHSTWSVGAWDGFDGTVTLEGDGIGISCSVASRVLYRGSKVIFDNCLDDIDQPPNKLLKGGGCVSDLEGPELSLIV
jgi:hypothetical protein